MAKIIIVMAAVAVMLVVQSWAEETCGENEEYSDCGSSCPDYCNRDDAQTACTMQCIRGCQCVAGFVREAIDSKKCIAKEECKKIKKCGNNKVYKICGSACPKYCGQPEDVICTKQCIVGCQCKSGYVLQSKESDKCIPENQCP